MIYTGVADCALLRSAGWLESIARDVESVDACVPILCGIAANRLYALIGVTATDLPHVTDRPQTIERLLDCVTAELSDVDADPIAGEAVSLVRAARRLLEAS